MPEAPGGTPSLSSVPAGVYKLILHERPNGDDVLALVNPGLGVYYRASDRPHKVGRYLILLHAANQVHELAGCLAPGMYHDDEKVMESRKAMEAIMLYGPHEIEIIGSNEWAS